MDWYDIAVNGNHTINFTEVFPELEDRHFKSESTETCDTTDDIQSKSLSNQSQRIGGIIKGGEWAWLARNCHDSMLQIISLRNGNTISKFDFDNMQYASNDSEYQIRFVEELYPGSLQGVVLAVCLERINKSDTRKNEWHIALYSVEDNCLLRCIKFIVHISCLAFLDAKCCRKTFFRNFEGCLSVGTQEGIIIVLDLNMKRILADREKQACVKEKVDKFTEAYVVDYTDKLSDLFASFSKCRQEDLHFGLQMEVIESPCAISSMLPLELVFGLAVGYADGRLALYDLTEFYFLAVLNPDQKQYASPLKRMNCLVPPDDPRPCFYICSLHESGQSVTAALHVFMYEERMPDSDNEGSYVFMNLLKGITRLRLVLEDTKSTIIGCQSVSTMVGENDANSLCVMGWYSAREEKNKLVIFDLNQWYKEAMPETVECATPINYIAGYILNGIYTGLHMQMKIDTIAHFNSMQRYEEHFYPNSLSFDCSVLVANSCRIYTWEGAQNRFINMLRGRNATIFLDPRPFHEEIVRTRLVPQFCEQQIESTFSKSAMYEIILSVALENNCYSLLRDCARSWVDGSFICNLSLPTELSLSTLTNWIFKRASQIKERCNVICRGVFESGNYPLDQRELKELGFITRQLRLLSNLQSEVLHFGKTNIPEIIFEKLYETANAINIAADYQEVLNWLLSIGLLPEMSPTNGIDDNDVEARSAQCLSYPFKKLSQFYANKRTLFGKLSNQLIMPTGGCRLLFIDALLVHYDLDNILNEFWSDTNGMYPPTSIEALLRVMLAPGVHFERKSAVLLYFLLDLNMVLDELLYKHILENFIKFQSVFKLSATLVKTVETFWSLDHDHFLMAVEQFLSPINNTQIYSTWQVELFVEALLAQNAANLALGILETRPGVISPMLKLKTLLGNEMISEAFHFARIKENESKESLLEMFFKCCIHASKFDVLRDLVLNQKESQTVQRILRDSKTQGAESLHFAYLLQKSKYIEAVSYMDEISRTRDEGAGGGSGGSIVCNNSVDNAPNLILTAYSTTMAPVTQNLTEVYFRIRNKIRMKEVNNRTPEPFSSQLLKQNANTLLGGIYHSSALSAHFATYYWGNMANPSKSTNLLSTTNAPFLRKPQNETNFSDLLPPSPVCRPTPYQCTEKRAREKELNVVGPLQSKIKEPPRKRRRLLGEDIVNDLTHFVTTKFGKSENHSELINIPNCTNEHVLTQPLPRPLRNYRPEAVNYLPGILKPSTPLPETISCADMDEKSLRFQLPQVDSHLNEGNALSVAFNENRDTLMASSDIDKNILKLQNEAMPTFDNIKPNDFFGSSSSRSRTNSSASSDDYNRSEVYVTKRVSYESPAQASGSKERLSLQSPVKSQVVHMEVCDTIDSIPADRITCLPTNELAQPSQQIEAYNIKEVCDTTIDSNPDEIIVELVTEATDLPSMACNDEPASANVSQTTTVNNQYGLGPKPRLSLHEVRDNVDLAAAAYVATVPSYKPSSTGDSHVSSGYASFAINSLNPMQSKINEFAPGVCSSKVCETQSKFSQDYLQPKSSSSVKLSECTTVIGSLNSDMAASQIEPLEQTQMPSVPSNNANTQQQQVQMLDTTLSMSMYDFTNNVDSTVQIQSASMQLNSDQHESKSDTSSVTGTRSVSGTSSDEQKSDSSSITLSEVYESELNPDTALNSNDCEESSIGPSVEDSVESSSTTAFESDVVAISPTTSPLHLDPSSIDDVIEINDQSSESNTEFTVSRITEELPPRSIYRVHSLETITEIETTKESSDEMMVDDDCVVALDGTEVREYVPRENASSPDSDLNSINAVNTTMAPVAPEPSATSMQRALSVGSSAESIVRILYSDSSESTEESESEVNSLSTESIRTNKHETESLKLTDATNRRMSDSEVVLIDDGDGDEAVEVDSTTSTEAELVLAHQNVKVSESESTMSFAWQDDEPSTSKGLSSESSSAIGIVQSHVASMLSVVPEESVESISMPEKKLDEPETKQSQNEIMTFIGGKSLDRSQRCSSVPLDSAKKTDRQNRGASPEVLNEPRMPLYRSTSVPCEFHRVSSAWPDVPMTFATQFTHGLKVKVKSVVHDTQVPLDKCEPTLSNDLPNTPTTRRRYALRATSQQSIMQQSDTVTATDVTPKRRTRAKDNSANKEQVETEKSMPRSKRGSSVPTSMRTNTPQGLLKRNHPMLDSIYEDATLNKPLTRSRQRLCSVTSDIDNSPVVDLTPKRHLRSRSVDIVDIEPKSAKRLSRPSTPAAALKNAAEHSNDEGESNQDNPTRRRQVKIKTLARRRIDTEESDKVEVEVSANQNVKKQPARRQTRAQSMTGSHEDDQKVVTTKRVTKRRTRTSMSENASDGKDSDSGSSLASVQSRPRRSHIVSSSKLATIDAEEEEEEDSERNIVEPTEDVTRPLKKRGRPSKK